MNLVFFGPFDRRAPAVNPPRSPEVHYWLEDFAQWNDPEPADLALLDPDEKDRAEKLRFPRDRRRFILGRKFIRQTCADYLRIEPADVRLTLGQYGKPSLAPPSNLRFSISHCGDLLLAAFAMGREVGVDLETAQRHIDVAGTSEIVCCASEREKLHHLDPAGQIAAFLRNWTLKEAYTKALGIGHQQPFDQIEASILPTDPPFVSVIGNSNSQSNWIAFEPNLGRVNFHAAIVCEQ